jgi:putrescine aminotransferase
MKEQMESTPLKYLGTHNKEEVIDLFARHVSSGKVRFFESAGIDFVLGRREGPYLWDITGEKRLIDCHCNGGVFNLGHRNPEVISTLVQSLQELDIGNHHLISEQRAALASGLAQLTPGEITYIVFGVGGGEAMDLAIKVARGYTGKPKVISAKGGYHGHTGLALAAGDEKYRAPFGPMAPGFIQVLFNDIEALEKAVDDETAAILLETIPATYGMPIPDEGFFPQVRELCDRKGILLIVDEVQTGLGRTGKLWGIEHFHRRR